MFASGSIDGTFNIWSAISLNLVRCVSSNHNHEIDKKLYPYSIQHMFCEEQVSGYHLYFFNYLFTIVWVYETITLTKTFMLSTY